MDISGKVIYSNKFNEESQIRLFIDGSSGIYLIKIISNENCETLIKVMKEL